MLRTKKDVDKHVDEVFRKLTNDKEKNLRCYNVAKLYHKVGDFQSAKSYVELYLKDRPNVAGAHKLLGQCYEGLKEYPRALEEYKCSLSFESRQPDLVLKVCELLAETKIRLNAGEAKYWIERAEEVSDNHQAVFRLKEHLLQTEDGSGDQAQLTQLVEKEIEARPEDYVPRIRLINLYLDSKRVLDAYTYSIDLESRGLFRDNLQWYSCIVEVLKAYQQNRKNIDSEFYIHYLTVLERHVTLCSRELVGAQSTSFSNSLFALDQAIFDALEYSHTGDGKILQECVRHMSGQLSFHLASAVLRIGKHSRTGWKEWTPFAWALLTIAYGASASSDSIPFNSVAVGKEQHRNLQKLWKVDSAFRCSQAGHILRGMSSEKNRFNQVNADSWRIKTYKLMFVVQMKAKPDSEKSSFFLTDSCFANVLDSSPLSADGALNDRIAQLQRPDSLHSLVWFGLRHVEPGSNHVSPIGTPFVLSHRLSPSFACHVFEELKFSTSALENTGVETLNRLDVDTFLFASVFCSAATENERHLSSIFGEDKSTTLPIDLTESLCSEAQAKWWSSAYRLHTNKSRGDIGEVRMVVLRGLEAVRLQGNHGMDVRLVVLLAKLFAEKASSTSTPKDNIPDISRRAQLFWHCAISLLERIEKNHPIRMPSNPLFLYCGKELSSSELRLLLEEGRFFLACCLMKDMKYEEAIEAFQVLKTPHASFYEGLMYKKLADIELDSHGGEKTASENKSQHVILLQKSRAALHLTLDRLRLPQNAGNHPLNAELVQHLEEVESCLAREESIFCLSGVSGNSNDAILEETLYANRVEDSFQNASTHFTRLANQGYLNGQVCSHGLTSTPQKSQRASYANASIDQSSPFKLEARPSPERLDAQLRRMTLTTDAVMQVVVEQNRQMLDSNKTMMDALEKTRLAVENLQKQMNDLKIEVGSLKLHENRSVAGKNVNFLNQMHSEEDYEFNVAPAQLRSYGSHGRVFAFPEEERFNYHNQPSIGSVSIPGVLQPQGLFPSPQVPISRNVDPNLLLSSFYPQSPLGVNFTERHGNSFMPVSGSVQSTASFVPGSSLNNIHRSSVSISGDNVSTDSYRKAQALVGAPILSHSSMPMNAIDGLSLAQPQILPSPVAGQQSAVATQPILHSRHSASSSDSIPHNFQISMPPQATIPTTESLERSLSPLKPVAIEAVLQNVPLPTYSAVSSRKSDLKPGRLSVGSASGNDTYAEDLDYNPCADFKPIVPLPAEITVTTGEEDETPLFVRRAKLFRYCTKEWKERGIGDIKILKHNITGKLRVLMRREQVHKICANHFVLPEMELTAQTGSDRAWSWAANDFSDGEARIEKLCVRFKSVEDAQDFKKAFDEARNLARDASPVKGPALNPESSKLESKTLPSQASSPAGKVELGGFSFVSVPVLKPIEQQLKTTSSKDKENSVTVAKPSPFAGFSFTPTTSAFGNSVPPVMSTATQVLIPSATTPLFLNSTLSSSLTSSNPSSCTSIIAPAASSLTLSSTPIFSSSSTSNLPDFAAIAAQSKEPEVKKVASFKGFEGAGSKVFGGPNSSSCKDSNAFGLESGDTDEFVPTAVFNPVVPLPSLVQVRTGEEGEIVLFEERAKLLRFDSKEWKERGIGKMKVLKNPDTGKVRLLMRREQVLKVCCNHFLTSDLQFNHLSTSDKAVTWSAQDFSEGEVRVEVFALKFKTPDHMHSFKNLMETLQEEIIDSSSCNSTPSSKVAGSTTDKPLSELFKPKEGSWECSGCFTRNDADKLSCPCCSQPKPGCESKFAGTHASVGPQFSFGVPQHTVTNPDAIISTSKFTFATSASKDEQPSLAELFKPKEGSWECSGCFTRNDAETLMCPCCSQLKPGSETKSAVPSSSSSQFSFGIPPSLSSNKSSKKLFGTAPLKDKQAPLADLFKPKEGSWECQGCYLRCDADQVVCASCNALKPGHSFGVSSSTAAEAQEFKAFSFGSLATQTESKSTFVFGAPTSTVQDSNKGFSFGSVPSSTTTTDFVFGATNVASSQSNEPSFGDPHKFEFHMKASSPSKSPGKSSGGSGGEESDDEDVCETPDNCDFKPVVPLPDKVPVLTGEEDETVLYCHRAKLYRFASDKSGTEWKERGLGEIKVLRHNKTDKSRLLMRREQVLKICLNHYILPDLDMHQKDERTWMWIAQDFSDGVLSSEKFACRFKSSEVAAEFKKAVDNAKLETVTPSPETQEAGAPLLSTVTSDDDSKKSSEALANFSFKIPSEIKPVVVRSLFASKNDTSSVVDDVEVVYEAQVTPEEKTAALKLKLPENFYRYKHAPPCAGCLGCEKEKDSDSDLGDNKSSGQGAGASAAVSTTTLSAPTPIPGSGASLFSSSFSQPSSSSSSIFGGLSHTSPKPSSSGFFTFSQSTAVNSHSTAFPILGSKLGSGEEKSVPFLPVNNSLSFASLAAETSSMDAFQPRDPSKPFSFAGAGSKVFGKGSSEAPASKKTNANDEDDSGGEHDTSETGADNHDPQFEPIVAMPDMVEVRTGEEEEEKLFCQRSKLFRYDTKTKEWKERGVGEIKILKHPLNGTFRLLLRRDQVHKVVLNQRIDSEMTLNPLKTSDKAWCWGGINHAEEPDGALEELAVRFKSSEIADEFRSKLEECQKLLLKGACAQVAEEVNDGNNEDEDDDDDYEDDEDGVYEGDFEILFEESVLLVAEVEGSTDSTVEGNGCIRVIAAPDHSFYVEMEDESGNLLCKTPVIGDSEVQINGELCVWKSVDIADDEEGIEKKFSATFESPSQAEAFQELFSKITLEIVERTYDYVDEQDD